MQQPRRLHFGRSARGLRTIAGLLALTAAGAACGDAPAPAPAFDVTIGCAAATSFAFPDTAPGQIASVILLAARADEGSGAGAAAARSVLDGPDAAMFRVVADASTCGARALAPGDTCVALVEYAPTAEGTHTASLRLGKTAIALGGTAAAAPGLVASIRNATSLHGFYSVASSHTLRLVNESATNVALGPGTFTGTGIAFGATAGCPATLTPGTACELELTATPETTGCAAGSYHLPTSLSTIEIPISVGFVGGVSLSLSGPGLGRVVSSPPGIDCRRDPASGEPTGRCEQAFDAPVTLTAVPDPGHHFNGWSDPRCAYGEACTVAPASIAPSGPSAAAVSAAFASPSAKRLDVTFAGSGKGLVRGSLSCAASCTGWIEPEVHAQLVAGSPSRLVGWSGACIGTAGTCDLGIVVNDLATTVTFAADDREQATLLPQLPLSIVRGGILPGGELVVAAERGDDGATISRLSLAGDVRWSTEVAAARPASLRIAPGGEIYVYGTNTGGVTGTLSKLDAAGAIAWQRETPPPNSGAASASLAIGPDGGAALLAIEAGRDVVRSYAADGSLAWSAAAPPPAAAVAIDPTGIITVASDAGLVRRFGATGAPLAPDWMLPPTSSGARVALAYGPQGSLFAQTLWDPTPGSGTPQYTLSRLDLTGATVFAKPIVDATPQPAFPPPRTGGIAVTPGAAALSWIRHAYTGRFGLGYAAGALLETYDLQGTRTWALDKLAIPGGSQLDEGVLVQDLACGAGVCAAFGSYALRGAATPWIEIFALP